MVTRCPTVGRVRRGRAGDTLIEVALCVAIVGLGMAAIMEFMASGTQADRVTTNLSIAVQAARTGWENARLLPFVVVQSWQTNPPAAVAVPGGFQRVVQVQAVDVSNVAKTNPGTVTPGVLRVVVQIQKNNVTIYTQSWVLADSGGA